MDHRVAPIIRCGTPLMTQSSVLRIQIVRLVKVVATAFVPAALRVPVAVGVISMTALQWS